MEWMNHVPVNWAVVTWSSGTYMSRASHRKKQETRHPKRLTRVWKSGNIYLHRLSHIGSNDTPSMRKRVCRREDKKGNMFTFLVAFRVTFVLFLNNK